MNIDMTVGKPSKVLWRFTLPLLISVAFQQFYNMADSIIAGNFIADGESAVAAIGASYPITMLFMAFAVGCNSGCSVIVSNLFGSHKFGRLRTAIYTSLVSSAVLSVLLAAVGAIFSGELLGALNTPENVFADAKSYLDIYVYGVPFLFLYNICNGIFAALGDSKTPLWFLIGSSVGNVILDIAAVVCLDMGVPGVAWATFAAQGIAAILAFIALCRRVKNMEHDGEKARVYSGEMLRKISAIAIPSILQQCFISVGNLFIQWLINDYGSSAMAGYSSAIKLNTFIITCIVTMSNGLSSYTAQNIGAAKHDRVTSGFRTSLIISAAVAIPVTLLYLVFGSQLVNLFVNNPDGNAVAIGYRFLMIISPFYFAVSVKLSCDAVLKGAGTIVYFVITTFTDLILRVVLAFVFSGPLGMGLDGIWWSWPIGWGISSALSVFFYASGMWKKHIPAI